MEDPGRFTMEDIEKFEFVVGRPVFVSVKDDLSTIIKPLDYSVCTEALALYEKMIAA